MLPTKKPKKTSIFQKRLAVFLQNKRAKYSIIGFLVLFILSLFSEIIANDKPIAIAYNGSWYFPIVKNYTEQTFGGDFPTIPNYKDPLIKQNITANGKMWHTVIPFSFNTVDYDLDKPTPSAPDKLHWLGTDDEGRDILARILYGLRLSVIFAFLLTFISSTIGIIIGAIQGYFGGKTDIIIQRFLEIWESLPQLFILIIIASIFPSNFWTLLIIMIFFSWTSLVGVVRAEFLRTRNFEFVKAAY
ncbi:MAG: ABC transporter permease subunit [Alphaproteobacteria bacterium]|nr:ABC transporter permease subunit [Alphaproteobacteria bacterium]